MRKTLVRIAVPFTATIILAFALGQGISPDRGFDTNQFARFKAQFESGDTNAPLLTMDWFSGPRADEFCRVSRDGAVVSARNVINWAIQGGHRVSLDAANMFLLVQAINELPLQSKQSLPQERQIMIAGIRSNQWFQCVYDRAGVPEEVERLYKITGAYLEWFIPEVESDHIAHSENGPNRGSQSVINSFNIARDAPIAVSTGMDGLQIWTLSGLSTGATLPLEKTLYRADLWSVATLTPDGRIVIFTGGDSMEDKTIYAFDWQKKEMLWEINQADVGNTYEAGEKIFTVGNNARSLFISEANCVEHWDLSTGTKTATLITNQTGIKFIQTSWNGKYLLAGFGDKSFTVWKTDNDEPVFQFSETKELASAGLSPDGGKIALCTRENQGRFILWDWQKKERDEFPLRIPRASLSAQSMYWSPDGKWLAANVDTYPSSIVIFETTTWKPVAHWASGKIMSAARFGFRNDGVFLELMDHDISGLDMTKSEGSTENKSPEMHVSKLDTPTTAQAPMGDKDFQAFQEKVKQSVDPFKLQNLAIPILEQPQSSVVLQEYAGNAEFLQAAHRIFGFSHATIDSATNYSAKDKTKFIVLECYYGKDFPHFRGLAIGEKGFVGPTWDTNRQVVPWINGVYFWNDTRDYSRR